MNDLQKVLTGARNRVAAGWTQFALGRLADGFPIDETTIHLLSTCVFFCSLGAIRAEGTDDPTRPYHKACDILETAIGVSPNEIEGWNDASDRTQAEVVAAFDRAIELAGAP